MFGIDKAPRWTLKIFKNVDLGNVVIPPHFHRLSILITFRSSHPLGIETSRYTGPPVVIWSRKMKFPGPVFPWIVTSSLQCLWNLKEIEAALKTYRGLDRSEFMVLGWNTLGMKSTIQNWCLSYYRLVTIGFYTEVVQNVAGTKCRKKVFENFAPLSK